MRILITGIAGFVGRHLTRHLQSLGAELHGAVIAPVQQPEAGVTYHTIDLRDLSAVRGLVDAVRPKHVYHLAAQAFVPRSFEDPWETLENNIRGQLNLLEASRELKPRFLVISTAEVYGAVQPSEVPIREDAPLRPPSPYSVSKIAQDMLGLQYFLSHQIPVLRVRPFNHVGPGQDERFVAPAFAMQIARIEAGMQPPVLHVGDLTAQRDFTDVRDVVRAYHLLMERGTPGEVYNVASGVARSAQALLDGLLRLSSVQIRVEVDPARLRPASIPILLGDASRLHEAVGWQPEIPFDQTLADILDDCRQRIRSNT